MHVVYSVYIRCIVDFPSRSAVIIERRLSQLERTSIHVGDCRDVLRTIDAESVDAVVTDPPYEIGFMGRNWDRAGVAFDPVTWEAVKRVLKPGGFLLAFGGTRTSHRMVCAIEDAGFKIVDTVCWLHGQGFPKHKSLLKPAFEPIVLAKKPGAGVLQIDACRIGTTDSLNGGAYAKDGTPRDDGWGMQRGQAGDFLQPSGRWPANVILDEAAGAMLDEQSGERGGHGVGLLGKTYERDGKGFGSVTESRKPHDFADTDGASRFFYCAKASRRERNAGLDGMPEVESGVMQDDSYRWEFDGKGNRINLNTKNRNPHPTVKPISLMRYLVRLATPPDGLILDPFAGSGSTGIAASLEDLRFVGIEQDASYAEIARRRIAHATPPLFAMVAD